MKDTKVAARYAKSLMELSLEQGTLENVKEDMGLILGVCNSNKDFVLLMNNPVIKADTKLAIIKEIFRGKITTISGSFMELLTKKGREFYIAEIADEFLKQYKKHKNILTAVITTSVGLDDKLRRKVMEMIKRDEANKEVELIEKVDKKLVGGFVLNIGDKRIDASVAGKLKGLRKNFSENPYVSEM